MRLEEVFDENRRFIWGLSYRMTGSTADADDVVQDTFIRLMQSPPPDTDSSVRPWLVKVAVNLSRDVLRRRRRQNYVGQWLPSPFQTENNESDFADSELAAAHTDADDPSMRFEKLESVSFAFLLALEALTPTQRAVLLLRDVFDYSVAETASGLGMNEPNVKTVHHRARKALRVYEQKRSAPRKSMIDDTGRIVRQLVRFLTNRDTESAAKLLASNVISLSDGGGEYVAAKVPVVGRDKVALFLTNLFKATGEFNDRTRPVELNGMFGFAIERDNPLPGLAPNVAVLFESNDEREIERIYFVMAPKKLSSVFPHRS